MGTAARALRCAVCGDAMLEGLESVRNAIGRPVHRQCGLRRAGAGGRPADVAPDGEPPRCQSDVSNAPGGRRGSRGVDGGGRLGLAELDELTDGEWMAAARAEASSRRRLPLRRGLHDAVRGSHESMQPRQKRCRTVW